MTYFDPVLENDLDPGPVRTDADDVALLATRQPLTPVTPPADDVVCPAGSMALEPCRARCGVRPVMTSAPDEEPPRPTLPAPFEDPRPDGRAR